MPWLLVNATLQADLPCGGCAYCRLAQSQWQRFEEDVDDVIPLALRQVVVDSGSDDDSEPVFSLRQVSLDTSSGSYSDSQCSDSDDDPLSVRPSETEDKKDNGQPSEAVCSPRAWLPQYSPKEMRNLQIADSVTGVLIKWLEQDSDPEKHELFLQSEAVKHVWINHNQLTIREGVLYYEWTSHNRSYFRLMLSASLVAMI